jgi:hypothetical protein
MMVQTSSNDRKFCIDNRARRIRPTTSTSTSTFCHLSCSGSHRLSTNLLLDHMVTPVGHRLDQIGIELACFRILEEADLFSQMIQHVDALAWLFGPLGALDDALVLQRAYNLVELRCCQTSLASNISRPNSFAASFKDHLIHQPLFHIEFRDPTPNQSTNQPANHMERSESIHTLTQTALRRCTYSKSTARVCSSTNAYIKPLGVLGSSKILIRFSVNSELMPSTASLGVRPNRCRSVLNNSACGACMVWIAT